MISQVRTATLSQSILPKPEVKTYVALILVLGILAAMFEAISPTSFSLVSPLSWQSVLKDAAKNLGIVVSFGLALAYIGHIAKRAITATSTQRQPLPSTEANPWTVLLGDAVANHRLQFPDYPFCPHLHPFRGQPSPNNRTNPGGALHRGRPGQPSRPSGHCDVSVPRSRGNARFCRRRLWLILAAGQRWVHHWVRRCCVSGWRPGGTRLGQRRSTSRGHAHRQRYVVHTGIDTTGCLRRVGKYLELGSVPVHTGRPCQTLCCFPDGPSGLGFSPVP